jgi:hypothetical protein
LRFVVYLGKNFGGERIFMYYPHRIEDICYEAEHIENVWAEMLQTIPVYFSRYIETAGGKSVIGNSEIEKLVKEFGSTDKPKSKPKDTRKTLTLLLEEAISDFEKDRKDYQDILAIDSLEEYKHGVGAFKNTVLKNQIPIIRKTLQNKQAKELDRFRRDFSHAEAGELFRVTSNIVNLAVEKRVDWYDEQDFEEISYCEDLGYCQFDDEENYIVHGVIGGGIKSHFIYKMFPEMYPYRSREALWALYYLTNKKPLGCKEDSQFLMIDMKKNITQQNYYYPYGLFAFYALRIFNKLKDFYAKENICLPTEYRFVIVDNFLSFTSRMHQPEIDLLKQGSQEDQYDY